MNVVTAQDVQKNDYLAFKKHGCKEFGGKEYKGGLESGLMHETLAALSAQFSSMVSAKENKQPVFNLPIVDQSEVPAEILKQPNSVAELQEDLAIGADSASPNQEADIVTVPVTPSSGLKAFENLVSQGKPFLAKTFFSCVDELHEIGQDTFVQDNLEQLPMMSGAMLPRDRSGSDNTGNVFSATVSSEIEQLLTQQAQRLMVNGQQSVFDTTTEVSVQLKDQLLPGTMLSLKQVAGGEWQVAAQCQNSEIAEILRRALPQLQSRFKSRDLGDVTLFESQDLDRSDKS